MNGVTLIFVCLVLTISADEVFEDSSHICDRCSCINKDSFVLDCSNKDFHNVPANWPEHNSTLIATFSYNNITSLKVLPPSKQRAKLIFSHCNTKYIDERMFYNVPNVEYIDLSYNVLTTEEIDGEVFRGQYINHQFYPIGVKYLNLAYNRIHSLPRNFFNSMPHLEELNLAGNDFHVLDINTQMALSSLTNLKVLNLAANELTELIGDAVNKLHHLQQLDLSSNLLDFVPNTLDYLKNTLRVLNLSNNYIFELDDKSFLGLDLHEVYLDNLARLEYVKPNAFSTLKNLRKISLSNNNDLKVIDPDAFDNSQKLNELYLYNNSLVNLEFHMLDWSSLKKFNIKDNSFECTCDLYNISKGLNSVISRNKDGPDCLDLMDGRSRQIYELEEDVCQFERTSFHMSQVRLHFHVMRFIIICMSSVITLGGVVVFIFYFLRYKKMYALRNYNFIPQVSYTPITLQN